MYSVWQFPLCQCKNVLELVTPSSGKIYFFLLKRSRPASVSSHRTRISDPSSSFARWMACCVIIMSASSCVEARSRRGSLHPRDTWVGTESSPVTTSLWHCVTCALFAEFLSTASQAGSGVLRSSW